ncbi:MAG: carboxypeptidase-like regulatory domain-containing protein, partial [Gemmatimonadales bacterium]
IDGMVIARSAAVKLIWDSFCWVALHPLHEGILFTGQVATDAQFTGVRDEFETDDRGYYDLGLLAPGEYYWRVRAETEMGAHSAWSQPYRLSVLDVDLDAFAESQGIPEAAEYVAGPGLHPLLGNPHWRTMPPEWFAQSVSELELVAVTDYRGVALLEECSYTGPGCPTSGCTIRRWSGALEAWLYTATDAVPLDSAVIWGSAPEDCPSTYSFGVDKHLDWIGDPPKEDYLKIFLWPYVEQ